MSDGSQDVEFNMTPKYAKGGINDLLLCLQSSAQEQVIQVYSHFKNAPEIFEPFGIGILNNELSVCLVIL